MLTYGDEDDLEDGAGLVSTPVRVAEKGTNEREEIDGARPFANAVRCVSVALLHHPRQEEHQVDPHAEEGQSR